MMSWYHLVVALGIGPLIVPPIVLSMLAAWIAAALMGGWR